MKPSHLAHAGAALVAVLTLFSIWSQDSRWFMTAVLVVLMAGYIGWASGALPLGRGESETVRFGSDDPPRPLPEGVDFSDPGEDPFRE